MIADISPIIPNSENGKKNYKKRSCVCVNFSTKKWSGVGKMMLIDIDDDIDVDGEKCIEGIEEV